MESGRQPAKYIYLFPIFLSTYARNHNSQYSHCELYAKNDYIFHEFRGRLAHSLTIGLVLFSISPIL